MNKILGPLWVSVLLALPLFAAGQQTVLFPRCASNTLFNVPYIYVETPPSTHSSWNVCVRSEPCDALFGRTDITPPVITISDTQVEVKTTFLRHSFGICPPPTFYRLTIPPVSTPGPITINYSNRFVHEGLIQVPTDPYVPRATITTVATTPVPGLSDVAKLALLLVVLGVGARAARN